MMVVLKHMKDYMFVQIVLSKEDIEKLLQKAHTTKKSHAVLTAVAHYLRCDKAGDAKEEGIEE